MLMLTIGIGLDGNFGCLLKRRIDSMDFYRQAASFRLRNLTYILHVRYVYMTFIFDRCREQWGVLN